jgi:N-methylhydantoinase A/oxoprolinase/acetone carboxylase beta subunit
VTRAGVDTGGTFTDVVRADGTVAKVLSTPDDPAQAVTAGLGDVPLDVLAHGTTVATNALLERRGARVALVVDPGFEDVIEIGRQNRPSLYDQFADRVPPLVDRELRIPVGDSIPAGVDAVAVCLLHADFDPSGEQSVAAELGGHDVTCSHQISPEFREYERTVTTVANAYLRPVCRAYLRRLAPLAGEVLVMTSAGGLVPLEDGAERPAALLLSGPAGGVRAAAAAAVAAGFPDAITFDMGGTSTDVCLVVDGRPEPAGQRSVGGLPIRLPALDIHTVGAGGGSIAQLDPGGALTVGPRSAGARPGPACYGSGGELPTVTDADLVLGRIPADATFPELGRLDVDAAHRALERAGIEAAGVVDVVDATMAEALRAVSVRRGVDPRGLALVAFGGAGPLHACALADQLGIPAVVIPPRAGVLSAVGLLASPRQTDVVRSWPTPRDHTDLDAALAELTDAAADTHGETADVTVSLDCRYAGQSHELTVASIAEFGAEHERRNGYARPGAAVEVVALRATARSEAPVRMEDLPAVATRTTAQGPTVLAEADCTVWVPEGWAVEVGGGGAWILRPSKS